VIKLPEKKMLAEKSCVIYGKVIREREKCPE